MENSEEFGRQLSSIKVVESSAGGELGRIGGQLESVMFVKFSPDGELG